VSSESIVPKRVVGSFRGCCSLTNSQRGLPNVENRRVELRIISTLNRPGMNGRPFPRNTNNLTHTPPMIGAIMHYGLKNEGRYDLSATQLSGEGVNEAQVVRERHYHLGQITS
jgi:hypothetical protein